MRLVRPTRVPSVFCRLLAVSALVAAAGVASAQDVTNPSEVTGLRVNKEGSDLRLAWDPVTTDAAGNPETVDFYRIFAGSTPDFLPDKVGLTNEIGTSPDTTFVHAGAAAPDGDLFYRVSAVDLATNEGATQRPRVTTPPVLSGAWTDTTIDLDWTEAAPAGEVTSYRVYYGPAAGVYQFVDDVGLSLTDTLSGLDTNMNWYAAVVAVDGAGNESAFSNEHVDVIGGVITVRAQDESRLCWGASKCPPGPDEIQRSNGWEILKPVDFPEGDWQNIQVTWTIDSRLCEPPAGSNVTKCGSGNPCLFPPCNGGYNTCGDPWDRTAHLFMVLDDCVSGTGSCITNQNLELMRAVTPFGTDALPPDGTGVVPPRELTLDITPYATLLTGQRYIGTYIGHFVQSGWWVTVDFRFSKRPEHITNKKPADGVQVLFFGGVAPPTANLDVPVNAQQVLTRLFITGHGGNARCDGGSNDGAACSDSTQCPGGSCQNCDEFCHRTNQIIVDGSPAWEAVPWRSDCSPGSITACADWNACGWPSCTFSRAGWCPGYVACHHDAPCDQDLDLTSALAPGASHDVDYNVLVNTGSWSVSLTAFWYQDPIPICGNGTLDPGEVCDGGDLNGETCQSQGFDAGTLQCNPQCTGYDTSGCRFYTCGNGICEPGGGEDCLSCDLDCNGKTNGPSGGRFCCGDGDGENPVDCSDPRCTESGFLCDPT